MTKVEFKKYRRRPVTVEAVQWTPPTTDIGSVADSARPIVDLINSLGGQASFVYDYDDKMVYQPVIRLLTLEGTMSVYPGYYICQGLVGEFWGVRPDVFEKTNEPVEEKVIFEGTPEELKTALVTLKEHD